MIRTAIRPALPAATADARPRLRPASPLRNKANASAIIAALWSWSSREDSELPKLGEWHNSLLPALGQRALFCVSKSGYLQYRVLNFSKGRHVNIELALLACYLHGYRSRLSKRRVEHRLSPTLLWTYRQKLLHEAGLLSLGQRTRCRKLSNQCQKWTSDRIAWSKVSALIAAIAWLGDMRRAKGARNRWVVASPDFLAHFTWTQLNWIPSSKRESAALRDLADDLRQLRSVLREHGLLEKRGEGLRTQWRIAPLREKDKGGVSLSALRQMTPISRF